MPRDVLEIQIIMQSLLPHTIIDAPTEWQSIYFISVCKDVTWYIFGLGKGIPYSINKLLNMEELL